MKLSRLGLRLLLPLLLSGCALTSKASLAKVLPPTLSESRSLAVEFIPQETKLCGPAVLKMATQSHLPNLPFRTYKQMSYREDIQGSTKADMLLTLRRIGMAPYRVASLPEMLEHIGDDRPVIVFRDLAVSWSPAGHFSLLVGYNAKKNVMVLHSDRTPLLEVDFHRFADTWKRGERWAYIAVPPGAIPKHAPFEAALDNAVAFEFLRMDRAARDLYLKMIERWPKRFEPHLGLANIYHKSKNRRRAIAEIHLALSKKPNHPALLFNLAKLLFEDGQLREARRVKEKTLALAPENQRASFEQRFTF